MPTTTAHTLSLTEIAALVFLVGLAIQRVLQALDDIWTLWVGKILFPSSTAPTTAEREKAGKSFAMVILSIVFAAILTLAADIRLMSYLPISPCAPQALDYIVTMLVLAGGTEASNSVVKYAGYLKESVKK